MNIITVNTPKESEEKLLGICQLVSNWNDPELAKVLAEMKALCASSQGAGLAAPQVGIWKRIVILREIAKKGLPPQTLALLNPYIVKTGPDKVSRVEGCLSIPGRKFLVSRPNYVMVEYNNEQGKKCFLYRTGFYAAVVQHELDHLSGHTLLTSPAVIREIHGTA